MSISSFTAAVVMPSGKTAYPKIEDNRDGTVTVRYQPTETGLHELHVKYNNESIEGNSWRRQLALVWVFWGTAESISHCNTDVGVVRKKRRNLDTYPSS